MPSALNISSNAHARPVVLVADDHEDTRLLFRTVLEILMDGSLPRLSGLDATRQIRGSADIGKVPIVFISGHAGNAFIASAREAGCDEYLVKPLQLAQLERVLEKYQVTRAGAVEFFKECA